MAEAAAQIDRLSDLPDHILHQILASLDTVSVVRTSFLSRRWRCLWKDVDVLYFQRKWFDSTWDFEEHVSNHLANRSHHVTVGEIRLDFVKGRIFQDESEIKVFDTVMRYAASQSCDNGGSHLRHLSIKSLAGHLLTEMLASVCAHRHHESIRTLKLERLYVASPNTALGLKMLMTLELHNCSLRGPDPFADFLCLKHLKLCECISMDSLEVSGPHLADLEIKWPYFMRSVRVSAPKLKSFRFEDYNRRRTCYPMLNFPALDHASIHIHWHDHQRGRSLYSNSREKVIQACLDLLRDLHNAESLILCFESSYQINGVDSNVPLIELKSALMEREASPFTRLKTLRMRHREGSPTPSMPCEMIRYFFGESSNFVDKSLVIKKIKKRRLSMLETYERFYS